MAAARNELDRLEELSRGEFVGEPWSPGIQLFAHTFLVVVRSRRIASGGFAGLLDEAELLKEIAKRDPEFSAQRARYALECLARFGLIRRADSAFDGLSRPRPLYGVKRHPVTDFVVRRLSEAE